MKLLKKYWYRLRKKYWDRLRLNVKFTISILILLILPVSAFGVCTLRGMEQHAIDNNIEYMQQVMEKGCQTISDNVEAVNMSTLVVTEDKKLLELLQKTALGEEIDTKELRQFHEENIGYLQRMLNSNPNLYAIRVYDSTDSIQEMLPILYRASRMAGQQWGKEKNPQGWYLGFSDSVFQIEATAPEIAVMVTQVDDYITGRIATVEVAIEMEKMFPDIYDASDSYYGCFIDNEGRVFDSGEMLEEDYNIADAIKESNGKQEDNIHISCEKSEDRYVIVGSSYLKSLDGTLVLFSDISEDMDYVHSQAVHLVAILIFLVLLLSLAINQTVKSLLKRFYGITETIRQNKNGMSVHKEWEWGTDEIGELGNQVNMLIDEREKLIEDNYKKDLLTKNAELRALHSQINAHFLYNVLGAINMIAELDGEEIIANAVIALGDMMHYSLKWDSEEVELQKEIKYIRDYIALINIRYDHQILLEVDVPEEIQRAKVPKMTLQPIVENAVKHGLKEVRCDTVIEVYGFQKENMTYIEITDHGKGMSEEELQVLRKKINGEMSAEMTQNGHGVAMRNIEERLKITYGGEAGLEVESEQGKYTKVSIRIPERTL